MPDALPSLTLAHCPHPHTLLAVVHACAVRIEDDYKLAATIGPVLSMQPFVSMSARPQVGNLH